MTSDDRHIAGLCFQNKVYKSTGNAFEDLFTLVMELSNPNFKKVRPQGTLGDKKNDGFDPITGTFYQVYAPKDLETTEQKAIKKLHTDFEGLKNYWPQIGYQVKSFYYVLNDKFLGVGPGAYHNIKELNNNNPDIKIDLLLTNNLKRIFDSLGENEMMEVIGGAIPKADISILSMDVLHNVIIHIMNFKSKEKIPFVPLNPDMLKKIEFNGLSMPYSVQLQAAMMNVNSIDDYFTNNNNFLKEELRNKFNTFYHDAKLQFDEADLIFTEIFNKALPKNGTQAHANAVLTLMSHFFECCDIFESPEQ